MPPARAIWESYWSPSKCDDFRETREQFASLSWSNWPLFTVGLVQRGFSDDDIRKIIDCEIDKISQRLKAKGGSLDLPAEAIDFLIDQGFKPESGARQIRRVVERYIEDPLAEEILSRTPPPSFIAKAVYVPDDKKLAFSIEPAGEA